MTLFVRFISHLSKTMGVESLNKRRPSNIWINRPLIIISNRIATNHRRTQIRLVGSIRSSLIENYSCISFPLLRKIVKKSEIFASKWQLCISIIKILMMFEIFYSNHRNFHITFGFPCGDVCFVLRRWWWVNVIEESYPYDFRFAARHNSYALKTYNFVHHSDFRLLYLTPFTTRFTMLRNPTGSLAFSHIETFVFHFPISAIIHVSRRLLWQLYRIAARLKCTIERVNLFLTLIINESLM